MTRREFIATDAAVVAGAALAAHGSDAPADLVTAARDRLVSARDSVSLERATLVTEAWRRHGDEPAPVRRALALAHLLDHMQLDLHSNPFFAGNTSERPRAWVLLPEYGYGVPAQARLEHDWLRDFDLEAAVPEDLRAFWKDRSVGGDSGIGHLAVDLDLAVRQGLGAVAAEARRLAETGDESQRQTRRAMAIACDGVIRWAARYRAEAARLAQTETDPALRRAFSRQAAALAQVPAGPARSFFEGLQTIALVHLAIALEGHGYSVSVGLPDRVLAELPDTENNAAELAAGFMLKLAANNVWGCHSKTQAITLGGLDHAGRDRCNGATLAFLEACDRLRIPDPHVFLRWHRDMDPAVKAKAVDMLARGLTQPLLVGDEETAAGFIGAGMAPEDAWDYCVIGCNELGIPGRAHRSATGPSLNYAEQIASMLREDGGAEADSMDALLDRFEARLDRHFTQTFRNEDAWWAILAERVPTPFTSALMTGAVERGQDLHAASVYPHGAIFERGLSNAVNGLNAIDALVFRQHRCTLGELAEALAKDFPDAGLHGAVCACAQWGNDLDRADRWATALLERRERAARRVIETNGLRPRVSCHVVRSLHWLDGLQQGATPDGRRAGEPYAACVGPEPRNASHGPTALLNSVCRLAPRRYFAGGYNLNLTLPPDPGGDAGQAALAALVETFFSRGGQELQVSVLDPAILREAMEHPERHPHQLVRIAGFTARFATLSRMQQEALVARAEGAARMA